MKELRHIPDFPGYHITSDGEVYSDIVKRKAPGRNTGMVSAIDPSRRHVLKFQITKGYKTVPLVRDTKKFLGRVHRLVMLAWGPPLPFDGAIIRHLDDDKMNNSISNLAWGTVRDNSFDAIRNGKGGAGERNGRAKLTADDVKLIRAQMAPGIRTRKTATALARRFGVTGTQIYTVAQNRAWRE